MCDFNSQAYFFWRSIDEIWDVLLKEICGELLKEICDELLKEIWDGLLKEIRSKPCSSVSFPFCQAQSFQEQIASNKKESGLCRSLIKKSTTQRYLHPCFKKMVKCWCVGDSDGKPGSPMLFFGWKNENFALYNIHVLNFIFQEAPVIFCILFEWLTLILRWSPS